MVKQQSQVFDLRLRPSPLSHRSWFPGARVDLLLPQFLLKHSAFVYGLMGKFFQSWKLLINLELGVRRAGFKFQQQHGQVTQYCYAGILILLDTGNRSTYFNMSCWEGGGSRAGAGLQPRHLNSSPVYSSHSSSLLRTQLCPYRIKKMLVL